VGKKGKQAKKSVKVQDLSRKVSDEQATKVKGGDTRKAVISNFRV
jgi:hypothetical protein